MNISNYGNYINRPDISGESVLNTPKKPSEKQGGFWSALLAANAEKPGASEMLYGTGRQVLSDEEIADLASRYDPENMTREQYESFLSFLEMKGAITGAERGRMSEWFKPDASGNLLNRLKYMPTSTPEDFIGLQSLNKIADRMDKAINGSTLMERATDPDSGFWSDIQNSIIETAKARQEEAKEDEKIELLTAILDNMTGRYDASVSAIAGIKLGLNADQRIFQAGYMPSELQVYLLSLTGNQTTNELIDEDEDADSKVAELDGASAEKLHSNNERRHGLTEDDLAGLAKQYDPNNMSREEYDRFLEDMVELNVAPEDIIRRIGWHGVADVHTSDLDLDYVYELLDGSLETQEPPTFQRTPQTTDIQLWIENRLLWKPGITRETARREGLTTAWNAAMQEQQTLARIAAVLEDVKRQRSHETAF